MNSPTFSSLISLHQGVELEAHVGIDDVIAKVYEEARELDQALLSGDPDEIKKEAQDVLINVLSVSSRFIDIDDLPREEAVSSGDISSLIARWGRETASLRSRYSRERIDPSTYRATLGELISLIISLLGSDIGQAIEASTAKFRSRVQAYLPHIHIGDHIASYPDFPKPGILFRDISPLLAHPEALRYASFEMAKHARGADVIAGLDARGFIFAARVADILGKPFIMIRKKGKLPGETIGTDYSLEYGNNSIEIQKNAIKAGQKVVLIDDLLATGGTLGAAAELVEKVGGRVHSLVCLISLDEPFLMGLDSRKKLSDSYRLESVLHYS